MVLLSVAFLTLLERKVLGYIQIRKGPNKVGLVGLLQPFSDAVKLFSKEISIILKSNYFFYVLIPILRMLLMLLIWNLMPYICYLINNSLSIILLLCIIRIGVYRLIISGWSSNSIYSLLGGLRRVAQTISYEVSIILIMFSLILLIERINLYNFFYIQKTLWIVFINFFLILIFFVSLLAELNRTPFDFSEGESELVSGFNTEYIRGRFALIFIAEYGIIILIMMLFSIMFLGNNIFKFYFYLIYLIILFFVIWVRGTYPRYRYDNLIYLTWIRYLPIRLNYLLYILSLKILINY